MPCGNERIETPVIFLTVLSDEFYEEAALKWGAVDFIDKSRRLSIILQRLKLITEGRQGVRSVRCETGTRDRRWCASRAARAAQCDIRRAFWNERTGRPDADRVRHRALHGDDDPGADVTYRQIYDLVRGKDFIAGYGPDGYRSNVRSFIKRIRKKFRDVDSELRPYRQLSGLRLPLAGSGRRRDGDNGRPRGRCH